MIVSATWDYTDCNGIPVREYRAEADVSPRPSDGVLEVGEPTFMCRDVVYPAGPWQACDEPPGHWEPGVEALLLHAYDSAHMYDKLEHAKAEAGANGASGDYRILQRAIDGDDDALAECYGRKLI